MTLAAGTLAAVLSHGLLNKPWLAGSYGFLSRKYDAKRKHNHFRVQHAVQSKLLLNFTKLSFKNIYIYVQAQSLNSVSKERPIQVGLEITRKLVTKVMRDSPKST